MCGFVGYLLGDTVSRPDIAAWSNCIFHRGPDQGGSAVAGQFGIGTRRLAILDLSEAGSQPMETERYLLGYNGEIYNHLELRSEIEARLPTMWRGHSDTETILRAIECWGVHAALERLNGMYALAIWDKHHQKLTLARDPLGIKPLLYTNGPAGLYFASELRALRSYTGGRISREGLALYLMLGFTPAPYSLLEDVAKVRPGEAITFGLTGVSHASIVPRLWSCPEPLAEGVRERIDQVRAAVGAAVQRQMIADVPVGVFLSGGVDSSVIAAVAAKHAARLSSFSIRPSQISVDPDAGGDAVLAARFARRLGLDHHELEVRPTELRRDLDAMLEHVDEPVNELYFTAEIMLSRLARDAGVRVVLTGHGGDEVFLGYQSYAAQVKADRYDRLPWFGALAGMVARSPWTSPAYRDNLQGAASVWRQPFLKRYATFSAVNFPLEDVSRICEMSIERVNSLVLQVAAEAECAAGRLPGARHPSAERFARMDLLLKVPEHYNMRLDKATMIASVEARVPLQDLALIGLVAQLPITDLWRGGLKGVLKKAFMDAIPAQVIHRPKQTFQAPMVSWVRGPLAPWIDERFTNMPAPIRAAVDRTREPSTTRRAYQAWSLSLLEGWRSSLRLEYT